MEQIRIVAYDSSPTPWLLKQVARREAVEETGLAVGLCKRMLSYLASPGGTSERLTVR